MKDLRAVNYISALDELKRAIDQCAFKSFLENNMQTLTLYWKIGQMIIRQQDQTGRGAKVIDHLAIDLKKAYPLMRGLSVRNLNYMRQFAAAYPDFERKKKRLSHLTWYHHITLLSKISDSQKRGHLLEKAVKYRWSRDQMLAAIEGSCGKCQ